MPSCELIEKKTSDAGIETKNSPIDAHPCAQHCYNFECDLTDSCGNADGTQIGNISFGTAQDGVGNQETLGKYLRINAPVGNTGERKVDIGPVNFNPTGFAISLWFNPETLDQDARFVSKATDNNIQAHIVSAQIFNQKLKFRLKLGNDANTGTSQFETTDNPITTANTWYHAVFLFDQCEVRLYLDGVEQTIEETDVGGGSNESVAFEPCQTVFQSNDDVTIGSQSQLGVDFPGFRAFDGCLDQVIIWKAPISQDIITELYNGGNGATTVSSVKEMEACFVKEAKAILAAIRVQFNLTAKSLKNDFNCDTLSVAIVDKATEKVYKTLVNGIDNLLEWPGSLEVLGETEVEGEGEEVREEECAKEFCMRLSLDTRQLCLEPLYLCGKKVQVTLQDCTGKIDLKELTIQGLAVPECHKEKKCKKTCKKTKHSKHSKKTKHTEQTKKCKCKKC